MYLEKCNLSGKSAFITGAGRGIGLAAAEALAEAGARVMISDIDDGLLASGRKALAAKGFDAATHRLDVADPTAVSAAADAAVAAFGKIDVVVANAGVAWPDTGGEDMTDEVWRKIIDIDLNGSFWTCREFGRRMLASGGGSIVTLGSMSGLISNKPQRQVHYNAAKAAVHHMTRSLAGEWADRGVRVNAVAPTYVDTPMSNGEFDNPTLFPTWMEMTPMKRVARPDEIASVILFLASEASSAMTGSIVVVDCGYTVW